MLATLYQQSYSRLRAIASRHVSEQDADDIVQDAFIRAIEHQHQFRHASSPATWITRIVINRCHDVRRSDVARTRRHHQCGIGEGCQSAPLIEQVYLRQALMELGVDDRRMCLLYDVFGYTHPEIASALGIPIGTSKCRLSVARRRLRERLGAGA
jgi:RNA polymerase sigma-70 factor (ECF subfamily)